MNTFRTLQSPDSLIGLWVAAKRRRSERDLEDF